MRDIVIQLVTAFAGSLGFALLFHVRREKLLLASLGGLLAWGVYLLMGLATDQDVVRYFVASVALAVYAESLARVVKCPDAVYRHGVDPINSRRVSLPHHAVFYGGEFFRLLGAGADNGFIGGSYCRGDAVSYFYFSIGAENQTAVIFAPFGRER